LRGRDTLTEQALDSEHELYLLHHEPSSHFCSLPRRPLICAHSGDLDAGPPNTLSSFQAAIEAGANCIEIDVSMTKDGLLVALHDRDLSSLLDSSSGGSSTAAQQGRGTTARAPSLHSRLPFSNRRLAYSSNYSPRIGDYTWDQILKLKWQEDGSGVALVQDVLDLILSSSQKMAITLDIKLKDVFKETLKAELMAQAAFDLLKITNCGEYCMTWSKSDKFVAAMKNLDSNQRVGLVVLNETNAARTAGMHEPLRLRHLGAEVAGVHYRMATAELTKLLQQAKREVYIWTANTAAMMKLALDAGPDAVVTSYPRKLLRALHARAAACALERRKKSFL